MLSSRFPPVSPQFPSSFPPISLPFPSLYPPVSYCFPPVSLPFPSHFPNTVSLPFSFPFLSRFPLVFHRFLLGFPPVSPWFPTGFPLVSLVHRVRCRECPHFTVCYNRGNYSIKLEQVFSITLTNSILPAHIDHTIDHTVIACLTKQSMRVFTDYFLKTKPNSKCFKDLKCPTYIGLITISLIFTFLPQT